MLMPLHQLQERRVRCQLMLEFANEAPEAFAHLRIPVQRSKLHPTSKSTLRTGHC